MITTTRNITDGKIALVERVPLPDDDNRVHLVGEHDSGFMRYGCKIAEKNTKRGNKVISEPHFKWFNALTRKEAFEYADSHIDEWVDELKAQIAKPKIVTANRFNMKNGQG